MVVSRTPLCSRGVILKRCILCAVDVTRAELHNIVEGSLEAKYDIQLPTFRHLYLESSGKSSPSDISVVFSKDMTSCARQEKHPKCVHLTSLDLASGDFCIYGTGKLGVHLSHSGLENGRFGTFERGRRIYGRNGWARPTLGSD